jgi:hypothetical protein
MFVNWKKLFDVNNFSHNKKFLYVINCFSDHTDTFFQSLIDFSGIIKKI